MNRRLLQFTSLALLCTGCAHFTPHPLDPAGSAARLSHRRLAAKTWTLSALEEEAERTHPDLALARAQFGTARAAIRTAGERPNPTVAITPQIFTPYTSWLDGTYGIDFDWTVETAGKRSRRLDVAHANAQAAAVRIVEATWKVRGAVRKALLDLYAAEERLKLLNDAIAKQGELLKALDERIAAGSESRSASAQPRLLQVQLRLQAADAAKNASLARVSLAAALGMGESGLAEARFSFAAFAGVPETRKADRLAAVTHRADVLAALADYAGAEATLRLEIAKQYPDVHLNPGYQLDSGVSKWTPGLTIALPILNQNKGPIAEAEAKRKEAEAKFNAVQGTVLADCDRAIASVRAARAKLAVADELLATQEKQVASEQRLVAAGEGDKLSLLTAQVERATTLTSRLDALIELQSAVGALEEATQTRSKK